MLSPQQFRPWYEAALLSRPQLLTKPAMILTHATMYGAGCVTGWWCEIHISAAACGHWQQSRRGCSSVPRRAVTAGVGIAGTSASQRYDTSRRGFLGLLVCSHPNSGGCSWIHVHSIYLTRCHSAGTINFARSSLKSAPSVGTRPEQTGTSSTAGKAAGDGDVSLTTQPTAEQVGSWPTMRST